MSTLIRFSGILLLLVLTALFNIKLVDLRLDEVKYLLGTIAQQNEISNSFGIMAKYDLIKRRMTYGEENAGNYEIEARIQALTSGDMLKDQNNVNSSWSRVPVKIVLNTIRFVLGKKIINPKEDDKIFSVLEIAYFWERNRKYTEALKVYDQILSSANVANDIRAAVMVHKAFCYSMLNNYEKSKSIYEEVINIYPETEEGILSWKLLDFIQGMEKQRVGVEKSDMTEMEKAKQSYLLMDFRSSIKNYSLFLEKNPQVQLESEARFYKGRAHEELGETDEAIMEYRKVMRIDSSKVWARQANRRMLMLGEFYEQQKQISDEAKKQLAAYQDQMFINKVEKYSNLVSSSSLKGELMKSPGQDNNNTSNDSILKIINQIGNLDLTGEQDSKKREQLEQMRREMISNGKLSQAEIKELDRKQNLAQNTFRRPSSLKNAIDDNSNELRYIYNKKLRLGTKLSGKMLVEILIKANGDVGGVRILQSNMGDQGFEQDIVKKISTWKFNAVPDSLGDLKVNYPFEFYEE